MKKQDIKKLLTAGVLLTGALMVGCGSSTSAGSSDQEASTTPAFVTPGETVLEATQEETEATTESEQQTIYVDISDQESTAQSTDVEYVVVLDPGHGGNWWGASDGDLLEKDLALQTALYCREYLLENYDNVVVYLTRETDMQFAEDQKEDIEKRVEIALSYGADILVSLHFNTESTNTSSGALVCVSKQSWVIEESSALANSILNQLSQLGITNRGLLFKDSDEYYDEYGVAMDYYAICRHSASVGIPGIIVEHCFMRNETDRKYYSTDEALWELARADAIGIAEYLGL